MWIAQLQRPALVPQNEKPQDHRKEQVLPNFRSVLLLKEKEIKNLNHCSTAELDCVILHVISRTVPVQIKLLQSQSQLQNLCYFGTWSVRFHAGGYTVKLQCHIVRIK